MSSQAGGYEAYLHPETETSLPLEPGMANVKGALGGGAQGIFGRKIAAAV